VPARQQDGPVESSPATHTRWRRRAPEIQHAQCSETEGSLILNWGQCTLHADQDALILQASAPSDGDLSRIENLLAGRLEKFGRREQLKVTWLRVG
jgi:hypothetical protein